MVEPGFEAIFAQAVYDYIEDCWNFQLISSPRNLMVATSETTGVVLFDAQVGAHSKVIFGYIADIPETSRDSYVNGTLDSNSDDIFWYAITGALDTRSDIPDDTFSPPMLWRSGEYDLANFDPLPDEARHLPGWLERHSVTVVKGHDWRLGGA